MQKLSVVLVGSGGYGCNYVHELATNGENGGLKTVGVVDPFAEQGARYQTVLDMKVPIYQSVEEFYANRTADLAIIATPIQFHKSQAIYCMEHGSHVLMEKPIAATVADAEAIIAARNRTGKKLAIGFQWCYDPVMRSLKKDIDAGVFGNPVALKAIVLWPRDMAYYHRGSGWAGKKYASNGEPIFDSVASNATAHYLLNMLWLTGKELADVTAETNRANPIETYDTIVLRGRIGQGNLLFIASHAVDQNQDPLFEYRFEKGSVCYDSKNEVLIGKMKDGTEKNYGVTDRNAGRKMYKLWNTVDDIRGYDSIACTAEQALLHIKAVEMARRVCPEAPLFDNITDVNGQLLVPGLFEQLMKEYNSGLM